MAIAWYFFMWKKVNKIKIFASNFFNFFSLPLIFRYLYLRPVKQTFQLPQIYFPTKKSFKSFVSKIIFLQMKSNFNLKTFLTITAEIFLKFKMRKYLFFTEHWTVSLKQQWSQISWFKSRLVCCYQIQVNIVRSEKYKVIFKRCIF